MLIVCSLDGAAAAYAAHRPQRVISLVSEDEAPPRFEGLAAVAHMMLHAARETSAREIDAAARQRAAEIVRFLNEWDGKGAILIHCQRGVARSMAAAYVVMCARAPSMREAAIAQGLRKAAPHADPCPLLVAHADRLMGRDGRMIAAIEDLSPPSAAIAAPIVVLPLGGGGA